MKAVTCPVCGGNGIVDEGFYRQTSGQWTSAGGTETCRSCYGKGWIEVSEGPQEPFGLYMPYDAGPYWGLNGITPED